MGLFRKKKTTAAADPVQEELDALKERLAAAERAKADLEGRLSALDGANAALADRIKTLDEASAHLDTRLGALDQVNGRLDTLDQDFSLLADQLGSLNATNERIGQRFVAIDDLDARLRELTDRLNAPAPTPSPPPPSPPPPAAAPPPPPPLTVEPTVDDERLDDIATRLDLLATAVAAHTESLATTELRLAEIDELNELLAAAGSDEDETDEMVALHQQLTDITERVNGIDTRVTSVSTELANQLTELSRDIDELNRRSQEAADAAATAGEADGELSRAAEIDTAEIEVRLAERLDAAIDDVLDTTERLAAEQARYEIQFRADLAELAERLRRPHAQ